MADVTATQRNWISTTVKYCHWSPTPLMSSAVWNQSLMSSQSSSWQVILGLISQTTTARKFLTFCVSYSVIWKCRNRGRSPASWLAAAWFQGVNVCLNTRNTNFRLYCDSTWLQVYAWIRPTKVMDRWTQTMKIIQYWSGKTTSMYTMQVF